MKLKNYFNPKVFASHASLNLFVLLSLILVAWRLAHVTVGVIAQQWLPYQGFFSYRSDMDPYQPGEYVRSMANFDGIFYIRIALKGYSMTEQAYFPLYPLLLAGLTYLLNNPMHAGLLLSNGCFALGFVFFYRYLGTTITASRRKWIILSLLTYPTAHYFGVLYTESLFFLLFFAGLFFLKNKRFLWAAGCAYALSLTRVTGVLFCIPALFFLIQELIPNKIHSLRSLFREMLLRWKYVLIFLASIAGILTYAGYLWTSVGDPLYFLKAQESFGANRSSHFITPLQVLYRYSKIFTTADYSFQYAVAILEVVFFLFAISVLSFAFWKIWKLRHHLIQIPFEQLGILLFSLAILIIPSLTGTLTAIPRYSLSAYGIFITLGLYCSKRTLTILTAVFILLQIVYIASFVQGYYVT